MEPMDEYAVHQPTEPNGKAEIQEPEVLDISDEIKKGKT